MKRFFGLLLVLGVIAGCGADSGDAGDWDGTCYDCRTVCSGCSDDLLDACLAKCAECQGFSDCFGWMEDRYEGMTLSMHEWEFVDCDKLH